MPLGHCRLPLELCPLRIFHILGTVRPDRLLTFHSARCSTPSADRPSRSDRSAPDGVIETDRSTNPDTIAIEHSFDALRPTINLGCDLSL